MEPERSEISWTNDWVTFILQQDGTAEAGSKIHGISGSSRGFNVWEISATPGPTNALVANIT